MNDLHFHEIVAMMVDATQGITAEYLEAHHEGPSPEWVLSIVSYTLISQLIWVPKMSEEQRNTLVDCVSCGERNPENLKPRVQGGLN